MGPDAAPAVGALTSSLGDPDTEIRYYVVKSLGEIGPEARSAVPALQQAANAGDPRVREIAVSAIHKIDRTQAAVSR
jgi:HEAT repeat protein